MLLNGNPPYSLPLTASEHSDPEVPPEPNRKAKRRRLTPSYKLQVLEETDSLSDGEVGAYLRRNALYWSSLTAWRRLRETGALSELVSKARGRKKAQPADPTNKELVATRKQLESVQEQLLRANLILEVQKKVLLLCGDLGQSKSSRA